MSVCLSVCVNAVQGFGYDCVMEVQRNRND